MTDDGNVEQEGGKVLSLALSVGLEVECTCNKQSHLGKKEMLGCYQVQVAFREIAYEKVSANTAS